MSSENVDIKRLSTFYECQKDNDCIKIWGPVHSVPQIVLIRHGEPDIIRKGWFNRMQAVRFADEYQKVSIKKISNSPICPDTLDGLTVFHSGIPRAADTAKLLFPKNPLHQDARFREFEKGMFPFPNISLPLRFWTLTSRILWYLGLFNERKVETVSQARGRASSNARFLISEARKCGVVILVAHGLHNRYVIKYLKKAGWRLVKKGGSGYLSINILANID